MPKLFRSVPWLGTLLLIAVLLTYAGITALHRRDGARVYRIGWEEVFPFQVSGEIGQPTGFAVEVVREAARRRGIQLEWVKIRGSEASLRSGAVDLWPLITITEPRKKMIHISDPYVEHEHHMVVRTSSPYWEAKDLAGKTVAHHALPIAARLIEERLNTRVSLVARDSIKDSIETVCRGEAEAAFVDEFGSSSALLNGIACSGTALRVMWLPQTRTQLGVGSTFESAGIADEIRSEIGAVAEAGELAPIMSRWGYYLPQHLASINRLLRANQLKWRLIAIIAAIGSLLVIVILEAMKIRRQKERLETETIERKQAEKEVLEWTGRFRDVLEGAQMVAIVTDSNRAVSFCNDYALRLGGWNHEEVIGRPVNELLDRQYVEKLQESTTVSEPESRLLLASEAPLQTKCGERRWIRWNSTILRDAARNVIGFACLGEDVTELQRLRAEAATRESEERFRAIFLDVAIGVGQIDLAGNVMLANNAYSAIVEIPIEKLIGTNFRSFTHPDDVDSQLIQMDRLLEGEASPICVEKRYLRRDGSVVWMRKNVSLVRDLDNRPKHFIFVVEDISPQKMAESALRLSEDRFRIMANTAPVMLWTTGPDRLCTFLNDCWLIFTGRTLEQEIGHGWSEGVHPDDLDQLLSIYYEAFDLRQNFQVEFRLRSATGTYRWMRGYGVPRYEPDGRFAGYIGSSADITDTKRKHEADIAGQKLETVGRLARGIAHDFNNLLGSILAETELARSELSGNPVAAERVEKVRLIAVRAAEIVRELMTFSGQPSADLQNVDLSELIGEMLNFCSSSVPKNAALRAELAPGLPSVQANAAQLRQVVLNLIVNASDALGDQPGRILIRTSRVALPPASAATAAAELTPGDYIRLEVLDTGCGMTQEVRAKIFDPFFSTKAMGRGLGLATVQGIVRSHGGSIQVISAPQQGCCFEILLPCVNELAPVSTKPTEPFVASDRTDLKQGTVLMVEDEESLRIPVATILRHKGFVVIEAADGITALEVYREKQKQIGTVLLDMSLPGKSGAEVFEELVRLQPDVKVVLTSAYGEATVLGSIHGLKPWAFIRKPYSPRELGELLRAACGTKSEDPVTSSVH